MRGTLIIDHHKLGKVTINRGNGEDKIFNLAFGGNSVDGSAIVAPCVLVIYVPCSTDNVACARGTCINRHVLANVSIVFVGVDVIKTNASIVCIEVAAGGTLVAVGIYEFNACAILAAGSGRIGEGGAFHRAGGNHFVGRGHLDGVSHGLDFAVALGFHIKADRLVDGAFIGACNQVVSHYAHKEAVRSVRGAGQPLVIGQLYMQVDIVVLQTGRNLVGRPGVGQTGAFLRIIDNGVVVFKTVAVAQNELDVAGSTLTCGLEVPSDRFIHKQVPAAVVVDFLGPQTITHSELTVVGVAVPVRARHV